MGKTSKGINYDIIRPDKQSGGKYTPGYKPHLSTHNKGGRVGKQLGGAEGNTRPITGTQRFDQSRGYYQPDMGMRGGAMYNKGGQVKKNKGGRVGKFGGGRTNLLEEVGRIDAEKMNPNRRAEKARVIGELNKGYNKGGRVGLKKGSNGKWIQSATASIKRRGTEGVCTGKKFGGPTCPPGSKRYNLAKTFKKMGKARKA